MVRIKIQLTEDQAKNLKRISASRSLSVAELIRRAIDAMIKASPLVGPDEQLKRALAIAGKFGSGRRDISMKHDAYLVKDFGI